MLSRRVTSALVLIVVAAIVLSWVAAGLGGKGELDVVFLDVGQGDAVFIESPTGYRVLIDGGPDASVLRSMRDVMPWHVRSLDLALATHVDGDHVGGLVDVFDRYRIGAVLLPGTWADTPAADALAAAVSAERAPVSEPQRGDVFDLGGGARIEVLFPDRPLPGADTNVGCIVTRLVYGDTAFLFPCDETAAVERYLVALDRAGLRADVLKAGHHGSRTSTSPAFVGFVSPAYAVISRGCDNSYGHPHAETIATLKRFDVRLADTCESGTITFVSDGKTVRLR